MRLRLSTSLLVGLLLVLTGCGGGGGSSSDSSTSTTSTSTSSTVTTPTITTQPSSVTVATGGSTSFTVVASGSSLTYQWYKDSAAISGATSATYSISSAASSTAGSYYVIVTNSAGSVTSSTVTLTINDSTASSDCTSGTYVENVICSVTAFEATLTVSQLAAVQYTTGTYSTSQLNVYKTLWSNLPSVSRAGITYGSLSTESAAAFLNVADVALTDAGYADFLGVLAAEDYLGTMQSTYSSSNYHIAIVGTPSTTDLWTLQLGGHHMAFNITFKDGAAYPTPHHIGVEPKAAFTINGSTHQVLADKSAAMLAIFYGQTTSLSPTTTGSTALTSAYLSGQTFSDILIGPVEYNTGSYAAVLAKYPTSNRGVLVSSLTSAQQALVTAAITKFASDYDATTAADLIAAYTSSTAYANTYVAWGAVSGSAYPNINVDKTYMRIDGPRAWIEISCQAGVVISGATHYHMMFRDKTTDYYNELSTS